MQQHSTIAQKWPRSGVTFHCIFYILIFSESRSYEIEMVTKSESQAITVIRLSPKAVQKAFDETLRKNIDVSFFKKLKICLTYQ